MVFILDFVLFDLIIYLPSTICQLFIKGRVFLGLTCTKLGLYHCSRAQRSDSSEAQNRRPLGLNSSILPLSSLYLFLTYQL